MRFRDLGKGRVDVNKLLPSDIVIRESFNYRDVSRPEVQAHIAFLTQSIRANGVQKPIEVEWIDNVAYVVDGECRLRAALIVAEEQPEFRVPVILAEGDEAAIIARSLTGNTGLTPTALEFGKAIARLKALNVSEQTILALCPPHVKLKGDKSARRFVTDAVTLNNAPLAVKAAVRDGINGVAVSPAAAVAAVKQSRTQAAEILKGRAKEAKLTGKTEVVRPKAQSSTTELADNLAECVTNGLDGWPIVARRIAIRYKDLRRNA